MAASTDRNTLLIGSAFRYNNYVYPIAYDPDYQEKSGDWIKLEPLELKCERIFRETTKEKPSCSCESTPKPQSNMIYVFGPNQEVEGIGDDLEEIKKIGQERFEKVSKGVCPITVDVSLGSISQNCFS